MSSHATKRKAIEATLGRRVRSRRADSEELSDASDSAPSEVGHKQRSDSEEDSEEDHSTEEQDDTEQDDSDDAEEEDDDEEVGQDATASISFGALAKAQASMGSSGRRRKNPSGTKSKSSNSGDGWEDNEALERKRGHKDDREFSRSSKHAPTEMSSKKAVSRKREVVPVMKRNVRDPRFDPMTGTLDSAKARKAYAFLDDYREDEMKELREQIKKAKTEREQERLKRALHSMESRKKAQKRKDLEQEVLDRHKKEQKERVQQGLNPFYLKKAELKKQMLVEQFKGMKKGQVDRAIERRRKKLVSKEKKHLPMERRNVE